MRYLRLVVVLSVMLDPMMTHAANELIQEASTHFRVTPTIDTIVQEALVDKKSLLPSGTAWSFGFAVEVPIFNWLNSGFIVQFNTGLPGLIPVSDLSPILKIQYPIAYDTGNIAPYIMLPLGFSYTTIPVIDEVRRRSSTDPALMTKLYDNGVGFNGSLLTGVEFFPIRYIGGFAEVGYKASVLFHQIVKGPDAERTWQFASYWIRGLTVSFGAKVAF